MDFLLQMERKKEKKVKTFIGFAICSTLTLIEKEREKESVITHKQ